MSAKAREELSRCIIELLVKEPFFGHLLAGVVRSVSESTPTAAVALGPSGTELRVNPRFFLEQITRRPERVGVVKHEALHLLFKHLYRFDPRRDHRVFNLAADLVVNQFVRPWKLPEGAITLATFPDLNLPEDQTAEWYYERLTKLLDEMRAAGWKPGGACAAHGGNGPGFEGTSAPRSADVLADLVGARWHSDHDGWATGAESPAVREAMEGQLDRAIVQARDRAGPRAWGSIPGPLQRLIEAAIERRKPKVDWRRSVRLFGTSSRRTRIVATYRRESRRFDRAVVGGGTEAVPGIKVKSFSRLAVAVDTSGSVGDVDLSRLFAEVRGLWQAGAEIDVIECDAQVQRVYRFSGRLPEKVAGRGGTAFDPVFAWLRDAHRRVRYDGCLYLTDGGAPAPTIRPPCKLLWVVTADGMVGPHLVFGRVLQLPRD
ncbi:MAG: VWA-like domain-containing protein [Myxococcota bacterium]